MKVSEPGSVSERQKPDYGDTHINVTISAYHHRDKDGTHGSVWVWVLKENRSKARVHGSVWVFWGNRRNARVRGFVWVLKENNRKARVRGCSWVLQGIGRKGPNVLEDLAPVLSGESYWGMALSRHWDPLQLLALYGPVL